MKKILLLLGMLFCFVLYGSAQNMNVNGIVKDQDNKPLQGVTIALKSSGVAVKTDASGAFILTVPSGGTLVISHVGFETKEVIAASGTMDIQLKNHYEKLDDIVVIGYGSQRKKDLTGSVTSISTKDFKDQPVTSVSQVLQGRSAGVQVISNAGSPGGDVSIRIRGNNSIMGNNNPLYIIDGFVGADYSAINPSDIASIEVLKDASATAIYGSRGANGVVLISTKKGRSGAVQVEFSTRFTTAKVIKKMDLLNAADFARTVNDRSIATGIAPTFTQSQIDSFAKYGGTDWQNEVFRTAPGQEYLLGISGGGDKTTFYVGGNYLDQKGVLLNSYYKRFSLRTNLNSQLSNKLSLYINSFVTRQEKNNVNGDGGRWSPVTQALAWSPTVPVRDASGNFTVNDPVSSITYNPVAILLDQNKTEQNTSANILLGMKYQFAPGLTLDISGGTNYINLQGLNYSGPAVSNNLPGASRSSAESISLQSTNNLTYTHLFNNVHRLTATAVFEVQTYKNNGFSAAGNNLTFPELGYYNLSQASSYGVNTAYSNYGLISYLGRVNYSFKDKYLVTGSVRRDGSSKFQKGNQYSTFPSVGLGWKLSEEDFIKRMNIFSSLKLRAGYGITGSQAINPYQTMTGYSNVTTSFTSGTLTSGVVLGNPGNENLKWESTQQLDFGIDAEVFNGRLSFAADYYMKHTKDLLLAVPVPSYAGGGSMLSNVGAMDNSGYEFTVTGVPVATKINWTTSFNLSILHNKVVSLNAGQNKLFAGSSVGAGLSAQPEFVLIPGMPLGSYWGLTYLGTWKAADKDAALYGNVAGDSKYLDLNGDHKIDGNDYHVIGHGLPKYTWGWNNTATYKHFTLNIFVQAVGGYDKLDYLYAAAISANADIRQATIADIKNRYIPGVNETSDIPAFTTTGKNYTQSTRFLEDGSFIRLKNISLGYDLPQSLLKKVNIKLFVSGANLLTITKYKGFDPETTSLTSGAGADVSQSIDYGSYPNAKSITAGVTVRF
ncbi:TonB-dependent receptor [Danxiaibacter flavus]|uniref:TonB-dependent receptor n=1 Tax=Danxiaibacter flavus TaxID=3049108 RepID=A0ABV3ZJ52_9BACT|nr:TonB-dependent receptor [Chitinophagaceae bacterium DXS]